jgi:hypothetical protein
MLEDGKIDLAESAVLLAYAKTQVDRNTKFADFVKLLENVREDGVCATLASSRASTRAADFSGDTTSPRSSNTPASRRLPFNGIISHAFEKQS